MTTDQRAAKRAEKLAAKRAALPETSTRRTYRPSEFLFDVSQEAYWCIPTNSLHSAVSVNAMIPLEDWRMPMREPGARGRAPAPIKPSLDIARVENGNSVIEGNTWMPGEPQMIEGVIFNAEGRFPLEGARAFNTFRPGPEADVTLAEHAEPWVAHVKRLWPLEEEHNFFFDYCAHMIQRPAEKCNAAIVLSGKQGIGKDAALYPLRAAIGEWNAKNIGPDAVLSRFNPWVECLMLTIDEVRPTSDDHKATAMYDALKTLVTTPPEMLTLENKNMKARYVVNRMRIFLTTNDHLAMYIPPEDRRLMVLHSRLPVEWHKAAGDEDYFTRLFGWLESGGMAAVAGWLAARDISNFNPKSGPPKTETWSEIAQRWDAPDDELTQALDMLGEPDCVLGSELSEQLFDGAEALARLMKSRSFVHRMLQAGYRVVPLPKGQSYWVRNYEGFRVKTSKAYIKNDLQLSPEKALEIVKSRLEARAKAGPSGSVPQSEGKLKIVGKDGF